MYRAYNCLQGVDRMKKVIIVCAIAIGMLLGLKTEVYATSRKNIKNGILEIQYGYNDTNGTFIKQKSGTGFLVANNDDGTYIVTARSNVVSDNPNPEQNIVINVIVEGDIKSQATIKGESANDNFAVLSLNNNELNKKNPVAFENGTVDTSGNLTSYGFSDSSVSYSDDDVVSTTGKVLAYDNYIYRLNTPLNNGSNGGPVIDADGYVIAMNNCINEDHTVNAVGAEKILSLLDNYGIHYESKQLDAANNRLNAITKKLNKVLQSDRYSKKQKNAIRGKIEELDDFKENNQYGIKAINKEAKSLEKLYKDTPKTLPKLYYIIGCLGLVIVFLIIKLIRLILWKAPQQFQNSGSQKVKPKHNHVEEYKNNVETTNINLTGTLVSLSSNMAIALNKTSMYLGKGNDNDICIAIPQISRKHAQFINRNGVYYLKDLHSTNGTFVNEVRIHDEFVALKNGDRVKFADLEYILKR